MKYYIVDAFTDELFSGNPAGVCLVDKPLDDATMQRIAEENNLSETAFVKPNDYGPGYDLRWFTPETEIDLCGHATLAAAYVLSTIVDPSLKVMTFYTMNDILSVSRDKDLFRMTFPTWDPQQIAPIPLAEQALGVPIYGTYKSRDLLLVVNDEETVRNLKPDMELLAQLPNCFGVIVTAQGDEVDFVSRFFAPNAGIPEDPVTGSSHCTLIPYWKSRSYQSVFVARQLSARGGTIYCSIGSGPLRDRVTISGRAALYLSGEIHV